MLTTYMTRLALPRDMLGGDLHGDLGLEWSAENADQVADTLQRLIDKGVNFYLVERTTDLKRNKTLVTPVDRDKIGEQTGSRKVYVKNDDIKALIDAGLANLTTFSGVPDFKTPTGKKAATGREAATSDTVALGSRGGG